MPQDIFSLINICSKTNQDVLSQKKATCEGFSTLQGYKCDLNNICTLEFECAKFNVEFRLFEPQLTFQQGSHADKVKVIPLKLNKACSIDRLSCLLTLASQVCTRSSAQ